MSATINLKPVDHKQLWQQMEPFLVASSAVSALTTSKDNSNRFTYYIAGAVFKRYDSYANSYQTLASPPVTPTVFASMRYLKTGGTRGQVISCPSTTSLRIAPLNAFSLVGKTIRIISGTGAGQVRTILASPECTKYEQGLSTAGATAVSIGDSTKKWSFNQWAGYQVRITANTGQTQIRRILYNDTTTLYLADTNYQPIDHWNNSGLAVIPVATAGLQAHFIIEANDITVDAWTINPNHSSRFKIETGGVLLTSAAAAGAFYSLQYYDETGDYWLTKTAGASLVTAAWTIDGTAEVTEDIKGTYDTGTATSGTAYTIIDTSKTWAIGQYVNYRIRITGGAGVGQFRRIICSETNFFAVNAKWTTNPDNTSTYEIISDPDKVYIGGNGQARLLQYDLDSDLTLQGSKDEDGISNILAATYPGVEQLPIAITSGVRGTGGITGVTINAGGTGHVVGDIITLATGANGKVMVTSISAGGVVTGISLLRQGTTYTVTTFAQSATTGAGISFVANVTSTGTVCFVTTALNHNYKIGDSVVLSGDALYAGTITITGVDALTQFDFTTAAAGNMAAATALSATVHVDTTKNWTVNEHVGKILQCHLVGVSGAVTPRTILSNTATTITTSTITTAMVNGTGRYAIVRPSAFGRDEQSRDPLKSVEGHASSGGATSLVDNTKNWTVNAFIGYKVRIEAGTGRDITMTITSNSATTLNYSAPGFTPDTTTHYRIWDTYGVCSGAGSTTTLVDNTKLWATNQWAGKRVQITGGAGFGLAVGTNEITIVSNTTTTLTFVAILGFAPDATTTYTILGSPVRGAGIELIWLWGGVSNGNYMFNPRGGGSNTADRYSLISEKYEYGFLFAPQTDTMTTGSYYCYDRVNRVYFSPGVATGLVQYVYYFDLTQNRSFALGAVPNTQLAPVIGNRMEIVTSPSGVDYLYHIRNTGFEMYRCAIWF